MADRLVGTVVIEITEAGYCPRSLDELVAHVDKAMSRGREAGTMPYTNHRIVSATLSDQR